jgi:hypothetical protein
VYKRQAFARAFDTLRAELGDKRACKVTVALLALAHERACEAELAGVIDAELDNGQLPHIDRLRQRFASQDTLIPDVNVDLVPLAVYDALAAVSAATSATSKVEIAP